MPLKGKQQSNTNKSLERTALKVGVLHTLEQLETLADNMKQQIADAKEKQKRAIRAETEDRGEKPKPGAE